MSTMKIKETKKAKFFFSKELNQVKFDTIHEKAVKIRDFKNKISSIYHKKLNVYLTYTKFDMIKEFNTKIDGLNGQDIQNALTDVHTMYSNNLDKFTEKLTFKRKNIPPTKLSMIMTFLIKYGQPGISKSLRIPKNDEKKAIFYRDVIDYCNKFGENRLLKLAESRRSNIFKKKFKKVYFNELSFRTITRIKHNIFDYNSNFRSKFDGFVTIGGYDGYKKLSIPTNFNKLYHGDKSNYERPNPTKQNSQSYQIKIMGENKKLLRIAYLIDVCEEIPDSNYDYLGVDVNVKHNLFSTELGEIDFDRDLLNKYVNFLQKIDNRKSKELSKRRASAYKRWRLKIKNHIKEKMVELCELAKQNGRNHLILEDLELLGKLRSTSEFGINYGRLFRLLGLSSIKNEIIQIAHNHKLSISFVQPEFSSQTCHKCGHISKENRKTQEEFCCVLCHHEDNADQNSSKNLQYRIESDVLKQSLLTMNEYHEFTPIKDNVHINMGFIKEQIQHSYSLH